MEEYPVKTHNQKAIKKVMCFGTFDLLHEGHKFYLREARKLGDYLVAVVALDKTVLAVKGSPAENDQETRLRNLQNLGIADEVIPGNPGDKFKVVETERPDVLCFGYDQNSFTENAGQKLEQRGLKVEVVRISSYHPDVYKSSRLRKGRN